METLSNLILEIYRAARETPVSEFQDMALALVKAQIPFRSAHWGGGELSPEGLVPHSIHLHNAPAEMLGEWASCNRSSATVIDTIVANPGRTFIYNTPLLFDSPKDAAIVDYAMRYGHINNMTITTVRKSQPFGQWLSLYRADKHACFAPDEGRLLELLMPHLSEALEFNRILGNVALASQGRAATGARAIARMDGTLYYAAKGFVDLVLEIWPEWQSGRLPGELMAAIYPNRESVIPGRAVAVSASILGNMLLLNLRRASLLRSLSPRELEVARLYGHGFSYKKIALSLDISPATVRKFTERIYAKLGINSKVGLASLLAREGGDAG